MVAVVAGLECPPLAEVQLAEGEVPPREGTRIEGGEALQ